VKNPRALSILLTVASVNALVAVALVFVSMPPAPLIFAHGYLVLDPVSRLFLALINLVFFGISTYVWGRVRGAPELAIDLDRFVWLALGFIVAGNLAVLSNHLIGGWIFLEATTLLAAPLVRHRTGARGLQASWVYFLFSVVGLSITFLGFFFLARGMETETHTASFFLDEATRATLAGPSDVSRQIGLALVFLGYGTKLGLAPMYAWLPETYEASPPSVTSLLAAVQFNVALVGVLRVLQVYRAADQRMVSWELIAFGLATMSASAFGVIATRSYKRLIAYASLNHGGVIAVGIGIGKNAAYGVVLYVVSNAFIKAILFLTAGKIRSHYQTEDMREVSGLIKDLPYSGLIFMVGTFALLGFPPFGSFLGELLIMSGLFEGGYVAVFAAFCTILTITFVAMGRAVFPMIWGEPKRKVSWGSQSFGSVLPKALFLCALVALGLYLPPPVSALFRDVAVSLGASR
jgi:hydrogenase-4 component F